MRISCAGEASRKQPMKELFGVPKLKKDGTPGNVLNLPPIDEIQTRPDMRENFIKYSAYDAKVNTAVVVYSRQDNRINM